MKSIKNIRLTIGLPLETAPFRKSMYYFFKDEDWNYQNSITDIKVKEFHKKYEITVTTHMPGMLIGKAGRFIHSLEKSLMITHGKPVIILIKEDKMWLDFYQKVW